VGQVCQTGQQDAPPVETGDRATDHCYADPVASTATVPSVGFGSPQAMEAACDAQWSRADLRMRLIIGGLMDGKTQVEIASETSIDRFKVARIMTQLQAVA